MGQTEHLNREQSDEVRKRVVLVSFIGSAAINGETIALFVDDPDGEKYLWGIGWEAAAYLSASMMIDAVRLLESQGMDLDEARERVLAHYNDARNRIINSLNNPNEEEE